MFTVGISTHDLISRVFQLRHTLPYPQDSNLSVAGLLSLHLLFPSDMNKFTFV